MASRRIRRTKSITGYLDSVTQELSESRLRNNTRSVAAEAIGSAALSEEVQILDKAIQSDNYAPGADGWRIDGGGNAEFGNVYVRGDINAYSGTIGYWNISNPLVERTFGETTLYGTFLESFDHGATDVDATTGTYVAMFKSYFDDATTFTAVKLESNKVTLTLVGHNFSVGDPIIVNFDDATYADLESVQGSTFTITDATFDTVSYFLPSYNESGSSDIALTETAGSAQIFYEDVAGLYLRDYSRTEFDYGYFSNKGLAYVSAAKLNAIKNPSFDFAEVLDNSTPGSGMDPYYVGSFYGPSTYDSSGWESTSLSTAVKSSISFFDVTPKYNADSAYGTILAWNSVAPGDTEYFAARVDYSTGETYTLFSGEKILNFNFDSFLYQARPRIALASATGTSSTVTVTTSSAHGLAVGDIVFLACDILDTSFNDFSSTAFVPFASEPGTYGRCQVVTAVTSNTFSYANPTGIAPVGALSLTTAIQENVIASLNSTYNETTLTLGATQNNIYRTSDSITVTLSGTETRYNGTRTVTSSTGNSVVFANPTLRSVTNKVIASNIMTITTSAAHGYLNTDIVELVDVDKPINISSVAIASNTVTLVVASAHQLVVGEPVKISGLTQLGADYDNLSWTTTTGTTGTTIKFDATEWITAGLSNLSTTSVSGPTARPQIFDGTWDISTVGSTTFTVTFIRSNYTSTAVTSAYAGITNGTLEDLVTLNIGSVVLAGTNAYEAYSPVLDLTKAKIQYGDDTTKTTSLYAVVAATDLANWSNKRQRSMSADAYMLSMFALRESNTEPLPLLNASDASNIKLDGGKIYDYYASLNPTGQAAGEDIRILFPAKLYAGTVTGTFSVNGDGNVTNSALVSSSGTTYLGYILDNVHLSTAPEYFDGNSGVEEYSWSGTADSTANHSSVKASKHWVDIDLETQAARIEVDYVGINESNFSKRLYRNAFIGTVDGNNLPTEIYALDYTGATDVATITMSSPEYEVINGEQHTYLKSYLTNYVGATETGFEVMALDRVVSDDASTYDRKRTGIEAHVYSGGSADPFSEMHLFSDTTVITSDNNLLTFTDSGLVLDTGTLTLPSVDISGLSATDAPLLIGTQYGVNTIFGDREIQTRNNGAAASFYVNFYGGSVVIGNTTAGLGKIDGTSDYVWANGVYGNSLASSYRSVYVSSSGTYDELGYVASSRRFKKNIEALSYTAEQILSVRAVEYHYNEEEDTAPKHAGMIAEEMHDAGLHAFISYDKEGLPETIQYEFYVTALQQVVRHQAGQIADLVSRIEALEAR